MKEHLGRERRCKRNCGRFSDEAGSSSTLMMQWQEPQQRITNGIFAVVISDHSLAYATLQRQDKIRLHTHLNRSIHVWPRVPQVEKTSYREQDERGLHESCVFNQSIDVSKAQVDQGEKALVKKSPDKAL